MLYVSHLLTAGRAFALIVLAVMVGPMHMYVTRWRLPAVTAAAGLRHVTRATTTTWALVTHSLCTRGERARLGVRLPKSLTSINTPPLTRGKTMHVLAVKDGAHSIARTTHKRQTLTLSACGPGTNPLQSSRNIRTPPYRTMSTAFTASTAPFGY